MAEKKHIYCPNCGGEMFICIDSWGYTPYHLHCKPCNINIGTTNIPDAEKLVQKYHEKGTGIEYYGKKIHFLCVDGKGILIDE